MRERERERKRDRKKERERQRKVEREIKRERERDNIMCTECPHSYTNASVCFRFPYLA